MSSRNQYYIYIITNKPNGTLYTGVTKSLQKRMYEHQHGLHEGFSKKYGLKQLVYYERFEDINNAISREKQIKGWIRKKKINLIKTMNPDWKDLSRELFH